MLQFVHPRLTTRLGSEGPHLWKLRDTFVASFGVGTWLAETCPGWCALGDFGAVPRISGSGGWPSGKAAGFGPGVPGSNPGAPALLAFSRDLRGIGGGACIPPR